MNVRGSISFHPFIECRLLTTCNVAGIVLGIGGETVCKMVLNLSCTLHFPRELFKITMPRPYPSQLKSKYVRGRTQSLISINHLQTKGSCLQWSPLRISVSSYSKVPWVIPVCSQYLE